MALLTRAGDASVKAEIEKLLRDPALEVRTEALLYMTTHETGDPLDRISAARRIRRLLDSRGDRRLSRSARPRAESRGGAAHAVADGMGPQPERQRARDSKPHGSLAGCPMPSSSELRQLLEDDDLGVAKAAIAAVGRLKKRIARRLRAERGSPNPPSRSTINEALAAHGRSHRRRAARRAGGSVTADRGPAAHPRRAAGDRDAAGAGRAGRRRRSNGTSSFATT